MRKFLNIIIFALYLACASKAYAKNYVVCVGISDYPGYMNDLTVSHRDASYIANVFRRNGNAEVHCLLNKNATVSNVVNTMRSVYQKAGADDAVILFFSGHGDKGAFRCYNAPMSYSAITQSMKLSHSRKSIVFADACMSGSMRNNNRKGGDESIDIMFFLSSRTSEPSREILGMDNSVFTYFLGKGLKGLADANNDRHITARELFEYVSGKVRAKTRRNQHPVMWGNFNDNMTVMRW